MKSIGLLATAAFLLAAGGLASADQLADIKARGALICGVYGNEEPFGFEDLKTRELVGYEVDICRKVAEQMKLKVEFKVTPAPSKVAELVQNRFDVLAAGLSYTAERAAQIDYSNNIMDDSHRCLVLQDSPLKSLDELAGKRVGIGKGSVLTSILQKRYPTTTVMSLEDIPTSFLALQQGRIDAACQRQSLARLVELRAASAGANKAVRFLPDALLSQTTGIGLRKGQPELLAAVNKALNEIESSGEGAKIFAKWLGAESALKLDRAFKVGSPIN
jgi:polar amino acid transport system substrate-binding protein